MLKKTKKNKNSDVSRRERNVSYLLLIILAVIGCVVLLVHSSSDFKRFGLYGPEAKAASEEKSKTSAGSAEKMLTSESLFPEQYSAAGNVENFNADTLYEKINGKAPMYVDAGFRQLNTVRFNNKENSKQSGEIYLYEMETPRSAFSVYSNQKRAGSTILENISPAYKTDNAVYFCSDRYYVEIVGFSKSSSLVTDMTKIAETLADKLPHTPQEKYLRELKMLPEEDRVEGSLILYLNGAYGFQDFDNALSARYNIDDTTITAFISIRQSREEAQKLVKQYKQFLAENGASPASTSKKSLEHGVMDMYGMTQIIFSVGRTCGGIHQASSQETAEKLALQLAEQMKQHNSEGSTAK